MHLPHKLPLKGCLDLLGLFVFVPFQYRSIQLKIEGLIPLEILIENIEQDHRNVVNGIVAGNLLLPYGNIELERFDGELCGKLIFNDLVKDNNTPLFDPKQQPLPPWLVSPWHDGLHLLWLQRRNNVYLTIFFCGFYLIIENDSFVVLEKSILPLDHEVQNIKQFLRGQIHVF